MYQFICSAICWVIVTVFEVGMNAVNNTEQKIYNALSYHLSDIFSLWEVNARRPLYSEPMADDEKDATGSPEGNWK